jgi:hypothetical protein
MKRVAFVLIVYVVGLGTGFYLWGSDDVQSITASLMKTMENNSSTIPTTGREDTVPKKLTASDITAGIIGVWQNVEDQKFTRTFSIDATIEDAYIENETATVEGRWAIFTAPEGEPPPFTIPKGTIYLRISSPEEVQYYKVVLLTDKVLDLEYLDGGGVQKFERKK